MSLVIKAFFYIAIVILVAKMDNNAARLKFLVVISLVHLILFAPDLAPVLVDPLILIVLVLFGIPLWISKETAILLLLIFMVLPLQQYFWLFLISKAVYVFTVGGLLYSALFGETPNKKEEVAAK
jgi:hypothetical protein